MLAKLIGVLSPRPDGRDRFVGDNMHPEGFRVYGGHVLAQAISAVVATVADDRGLDDGSFYTREGRLVASTVQQGVMRLRETAT